MSVQESVEKLFDLQQPCYKTIIAGYSNALHPQYSGVAKQLYSKIFSILSKSGIDYFCFAGALVGYVRNRSIPPWLDDMDVMIFEKDFELFESTLVPLFKSCGFECTPKKMLQSDGEKAGYQVRALFSNNGRRAENQTLKFSDEVFVEVPRLQVDFFFSRVTDSVVQNINGWGLYHKKKIKADWVFPGQSIIMDGISMHSFSDIFSDVRHEYGDVNNEIVIQNHTTVVYRSQNIPFDQFDQVYQNLVSKISFDWPGGLSEQDFKSAVLDKEQFLKFNNDASFIFIVKSILEHGVGTIQLSQNSILWAPDLKYLFPDLHVSAFLSTRLDAQRSVLLSSSINKIRCSRMALKKSFNEWKTNLLSY